MLIFRELHTTKSHFFCVILPRKVIFLTVTKSVQIGLFRASIVKFAKGVTFPKSDILKNVHSHDTKKYFFPVNTGGVSRF